MLKQKFDVGYNVFVEIKHSMKSQIGSNDKEAIFERVKDIFMVGDRDENVIKQSDLSSDDRLVFSLPQKYARKLA